MKTSIYVRLLLGLGIAIAIFASSMRASLDDILAPLPIANMKVTPVVAMASTSKVFNIDNFEEDHISDSIAGVTTEYQSTYAPIDGILSSDVREAIVETLESSLRPNGEITLIPLREMPDLSSYARPFNINVLNMPGRLSRGNLLLSFQVENEKGVLGQWNVPFRVHLYNDVWFAKAHLRRGDLASASDFEIRQVDSLVTTDAVPATLEMLLRHEYGKDIMPGKPLVWSDLVERALIRKGDVVEVSAIQGLLAVTVRAVARQDGSEGDLILFRNIDSAKEFSARVIGENRAEIIF